MVVKCFINTRCMIWDAQALSPVGRCQTFDAMADGYGRGEACAVLVLQSLKGSIEADSTLALIQASFLNDHGSIKHCSDQPTSTWTSKERNCEQ